MSWEQEPEHGSDWLTPGFHGWKRRLGSVLLLQAASSTHRALLLHSHGCRCRGGHALCSPVPAPRTGNSLGNGQDVSSSRLWLRLSLLSFAFEDA